MTITTQMAQHSNCLNSTLHSPRCFPYLLGECNFPEVVCSMVPIIYSVADGGHLNPDATCTFVLANCWPLGRVRRRLPVQRFASTVPDGVYSWPSEQIFLLLFLQHYCLRLGQLPLVRRQKRCSVKTNEPVPLLLTPPSFLSLCCYLH